MRDPGSIWHAIKRLKDKAEMEKTEQRGGKLVTVKYEPVAMYEEA